MKKIISVSRRTDIPAFYGDWFMNRIAEGFVGYVNPYSGQKYKVSLKPEDVLCFVFWSKNYQPFLKHLERLANLGYRFYFNFTLTGLPKLFECNLVDTKVAIETMKDLSKMFSPKHINWRYDPILLSDATDYEFHLDRFEQLASELEGYVERCYFSFVIQYGKVKRNFDQFTAQSPIKFFDPEEAELKMFANDLADIGSKYKIKMLTCCGDYLLNDKIKKAHCIDGEIIENLFLTGARNLKEKPTRNECGCVNNTDIGAYDTCPHGCIYCYANMNKDIACKKYQEHEVGAAFLGYSVSDGKKWMDEILEQQTKKGNDMPSLFEF